MSDRSQSTAVATTAPAPRPVVMVEHTQALFDTARFEQFQRVASALKYSTILAESIRGTTPEQCFSNLMIVCELAERWQMSPSALAQSISIIHNKVVIEGKAIQAALDATLGIELYPWWTGQRGTDDYRIFLSDQPWDDLDDETLENLKPGLQIKGRKIVDGSVGEWKTSYKDKSGRWVDNAAWTGASSQDQLLYRATRQWTRRYKPSLMLGVYAPDEIEAIEVRRDRKAPAEVAPITAGFTAAPVQKAEDIEDAVVEETVSEGQDPSPAEPTTDPDAGKKVEDPEDVDPVPTGAERNKIIAAAFNAARDGLSFPVNMAWGEEILSEVDAAIERGTVQRNGDLFDAVIAAVAMGQVPSYEGIPDGEIERLKSAVEATHQFRERVLEAARDGLVADAIDLDDPFDPIILDVAGIGDVTIPDGAVAALFTEAEELIDQAKAKAVAGKVADMGNPITEEDQAVPEELKAAGESSEDGDEDLEDAGDDADPWRVKLETCSSWVEIKTAFVALTKTDAWASFDEEEQNRLRALTWGRQQEINDSGAERLDMISDFTAFRCWIEYTTDPDAIDGNWQTLTAGEAWVNAPVRIRDALVPAVRERLRALR